ncbi:hypothetical protein LCGC14_3077380, partial [marine sediment metagenome]
MIRCGCDIPKLGLVSKRTLWGRNPMHDEFDY